MSAMDAVLDVLNESDHSKVDAALEYFKVVHENYKISLGLFDEWYNEKYGNQ